MTGTSVAAVWSTADAATACWMRSGSYGTPPEHAYTAALARLTAVLTDSRMG
jgi:hypothetical protein